MTSDQLKGGAFIALLAAFGLWLVFKPQVAYKYSKLPSLDIPYSRAKFYIIGVGLFFSFFPIGVIAVIKLFLE